MDESGKSNKSSMQPFVELWPLVLIRGRSVERTPPPRNHNEIGKVSSAVNRRWVRVMNWVINIGHCTSTVAYVRSGPVDLREVTGLSKYETHHVQDMFRNIKKFIINSSVVLS